MLVKRSSKFVHSTEPNQREHLGVLSFMNTDRGCIPNFYILKGSYFCSNYIANCEGVVMGIQPNAWMTGWLFKSWISHFIMLKKGHSLDLTNSHLLMLDGLNSHVTLEVVKISMESSLDIVSPPSHISHALQPLDVACFKLFKIAFTKMRDRWSLTNKTRDIDKQTL